MLVGAKKIEKCKLTRHVICNSVQNLFQITGARKPSANLLKGSRIRKNTQSFIRLSKQSKVSESQRLCLKMAIVATNNSWFSVLTSTYTSPCCSLSYYQRQLSTSYRSIPLATSPKAISQKSRDSKKQSPSSGKIKIRREVRPILPHSSF